MSSLMRLFIPEAGRHAVGARCSCGHRRADHDDRWAVRGGLLLDVPGHGRCDVPGCRCRRFRWAAWIFARPARRAAPGGGRLRAALSLAR